MEFIVNCRAARECSLNRGDNPSSDTNHCPFARRTIRIDITLPWPQQKQSYDHQTNNFGRDKHPDDQPPCFGRRISRWGRINTNSGGTTFGKLIGPSAIYEVLDYAQIQNPPAEFRKTNGSR